MSVRTVMRSWIRTWTQPRRRVDLALLAETKKGLAEIVQGELLPALEQLRAANLKIFDRWRVYVDSLQGWMGRRHNFALPVATFTATEDEDYPGSLDNSNSAIARWRRVLEKNGGTFLFEEKDENHGAGRREGPESMRGAASQCEPAHRDCTEA